MRNSCGAVLRQSDAPPDERCTTGVHQTDLGGQVGHERLEVLVEEGSGEIGEDFFLRLLADGETLEIVVGALVKLDRVQVAHRIFAEEVEGHSRRRGELEMLDAQTAAAD